MHVKLFPIYIFGIFLGIFSILDKLKKILEELRKLNKETHEGRTKLVSKTTSYTSIIDPKQYAEKKVPEDKKFFSGEQFK